MFFLIFSTNAMGISAVHIGTLLFAACLLDGFTDVGAGRLIEPLRPGRSGRFKPWLLRVMIPSAPRCRSSAPWEPRSPTSAFPWPCRWWASSR